MKNLFKISLLLVVSSFIFACGGTANDPKAVAKDFMEALAEQDYSKAKDLGTETTKQTIGLIESMVQMAKQMGQDADNSEMTKEFEGLENAEWSDAEIDGDNAIVKYKVGDKEEKVDLKKVDGKWKVDMKKEM